MSRIIDTMEEFERENVHMKNQDRVEEILSEILKGGFSKLQVITDFDYTLSRAHKNGKQCASTHGVLKQSPLTSEEYKNKTIELFNHYHPIEVDPNLTKEEKVPHMVEWYTKGMNLMSSSGITRDSIPIMVENSSISLRDGCDVFLEVLGRRDVPTLIFSAGVGDVLLEVLEQDDSGYLNMKIIANFLKFDEQNKLIGYQGNLIHPFNKKLSCIENEDYFQKLKSRNNIILLGDSLGDLDMAEGAEDVNVILKIGFLNFKIEENLPKYLDAFDIVLSDDQTMNVLIDLILLMLKQSNETC